jgi:bifunctional DNase/RNase
MLFWFLAATNCGAQSTVNQSTQTIAENKELIPVTVYQLVVDPTSRQPVVTLADAGEQRALFIWIGLAEARAIYSELEGVEPQRPLTHDLLEEIILKTRGEIRRIVVTHSRDNIYFATIFLQRADKLIEIDARPSDALVLALKFKASVYVSRDLFEKMSLPLKSREDREDSYGLSLQELTPDLAKYLAFESGKGVMVSGVQKGSQAAMDGLRIGDIIVAIEDRIVEDLPFFQKAFKESKRPLKAKIYRNNRFLTLTVHPE